MGGCYAARQSRSQSQRSDRIGRLPHQGADPWVDAVNADGTYGRCAYAVAKKPGEAGQKLTDVSQVPA